MTNIKLLSQVSDISLEDYCSFGLATCFVRDEGEIHQVKVVEPIPSAALEAILQGIPTSYEFVCGQTLDNFFVEDTPIIPQEFPASAQLCDRFTERAIAATRTFKTRPSAAKHIPIGTIKQDLNYSLSKKRVLNDSSVVRVEDNVKQHEYTHKIL
ncbi:conserved hypothetical protein [Hyella patelloides LEGE 07179]|uniref:Uncharacterized protein n=1 Tax=Hyella patelloides LEGE 07179 TaxID=945734 RepID=A0A563VZG1_9CYAN|nr:hypothetical protein [Hyella patelloides]VEP16785.1 conserved hypothetical protein [Hyella patelloides LEGE 07179]